MLDEVMRLDWKLKELRGRMWRESWLMVWGFIGECYLRDHNLMVAAKGHNTLTDDVVSLRSTAANDLNRLADAVAALATEVCRLSENSKNVVFNGDVN